MTLLLPPVPARCFPDDFVWGVATSAYQIEGAGTLDGKGESNWDAFCRVPGAIADGSDGSVACDHYHRWPQDLDLIAQLGVDAYRFSISWPRVQPGGSGSFNEHGLAFYDRLVDGLLQRGVTPYLTLHHWDLPLELEQAGGWANRDTAHRFVDFARHVARRLGDRVPSIATLNEPWVMAMLGYETGQFAPGIKHRATAMRAAHHLLLAHGLALQALRADGCASRLGIVLNLSPVQAASDSAADREQARIDDGRLLRWYMDALLLGRYPHDIVSHLGDDMPAIREGDLEHIAQPLDFLGINYYSRAMASASGPWDASRSGLELTDMGWEIYPQGLTELLLRLHRDYRVPPLFVTENGGAFKDVLDQGRVHDSARIAYIANHIGAVGDALDQGVPMAGYMVWSLLDNFEWSFGYAKRFGIVHVDYTTQQRTLKDSALWYRDFLAGQRQRRLQPGGPLQAGAAAGAMIRD